CSSQSRQHSPRTTTGVPAEQRNQRASMLVALRAHPRKSSPNSIFSIVSANFGSSQTNGKAGVALALPGEDQLSANAIRFHMLMGFSDGVHREHLVNHGTKASLFKERQDMLNESLSQRGLLFEGPPSEDRPDELCALHQDLIERHSCGRS